MRASGSRLIPHASDRASRWGLCFNSTDYLQGVAPGFSCCCASTASWRYHPRVLRRGDEEFEPQGFAQSPALRDLVAADEDEHHAIEPASDADMLRHLMEAKGITRAQLCHDAGLPKSSISEILAGRKPFSRQVIRRLAEYFKVEVGVLAANLLTRASRNLPARLPTSPAPACPTGWGRWRRETRCPC